MRLDEALELLDGDVVDAPALDWALRLTLRKRDRVKTPTAKRQWLKVSLMESLLLLVSG